ncbi:hypothetical protein [Paraburkholderia pallida]|uniref:Uncharacterized protein n=1 Tax=Paraburkholderia pallida TaxID=2547399 RepID=A0A4P7CQF4_9BURK|nr:hypothetical protein [Paraburkholderia pallida]QBQ95923.1 hypothetical protein E1956_01155 [Paraburkholderia pallida]
MSRHRKPPALPPDESSAQLRERLRRFALATRDDATRTATLSFPGHVTVLAGPLHCHRPHLAHPSAPARSGPQRHGAAGAGQADGSDLP